MPEIQYSLFGDTSQLPFTARSVTRHADDPDSPLLRYEIDALTDKETWGAGNGNTTIVCRQKWLDTFAWIRDMVGEVEVTRPGSTYLLNRYVPEIVQYGDGRKQFCTIVDQLEQGGNPTDVIGQFNFQQAVNFWPKTLWCKYRTVFESPPYAILSTSDLTAISAAAGDYAGAKELYRYCVRTRKTYSREQPIPAASTAGGFKVIDDAVPANRKPIGQVGFKVVSMADITIKWVRVPIGWPPPVGYDADVPGIGLVTWPPLVNPVVLDITKQRTRDTYKGTINADWFDCAAPDGLCIPPGELLYIGYDDSNKYIDAAGDWVTDITFTFRQKEGGWNKFLSALGEWKEVSLDGTSGGARPYGTNNFNNLFQAS